MANTCVEDAYSNKAFNKGQLSDKHGGTPCSVEGCTIKAKCKATNEISLDDPPGKGGYRGTVDPLTGIRGDIALPQEGSNSAVRKGIVVDSAVAHRAKPAQKSRKRKSDAPPSATSPSIGAKKLSLANSANSMQTIYSLGYARAYTAYTAYMQMMAPSRSQVGGVAAGRQHSGAPIAPAGSAQRPGLDRLAEPIFANTNPHSSYYRSSDISSISSIRGSANTIFSQLE